MGAAQGPKAAGGLGEFPPRPPCGAASLWNTSNPAQGLTGTESGISHLRVKGAGLKTLGEETQWPVSVLSCLEDEPPAPLCLLHSWP